MLDVLDGYVEKKRVGSEMPDDGNGNLRKLRQTALLLDYILDLPRFRANLAV